MKSQIAANEKPAPIIGIVPTYKSDGSLLELPQRYVDAIIAAGGVPIVLPFATQVDIYQTLLPNIDGFLLSGGQDIDPVRYGETIVYGEAEELTPGREEVEYLILSFARKYDIPVLGICRGMQMMNVAFGGALYQDIGEQANHLGHYQTEDYRQPTHRVRILKDTKLYDILGCEVVPVNSMHHQGVRDVAPEFSVSAYSEDGLIEAIEAPSLSFMIGVQWHPEFFAQKDGSMAPLLARLVKEADSVHIRTKRSRSHLNIMREEYGGYFPNIQFTDGAGI